MAGSALYVGPPLGAHNDADRASATRAARKCRRRLTAPVRFQADDGRRDEECHGRSAASEQESATIVSDATFSVGRTLFSPLPSATLRAGFGEVALVARCGE